MKIITTPKTFTFECTERELAYLKIAAGRMSITDDREEGFEDIGTTLYETLKQAIGDE